MARLGDGSLAAAARWLAVGVLWAGGVAPYAAEPARCAMLVTLFGQGNVMDAEFPLTLQTFY